PPPTPGHFGKARRSTSHSSLLLPFPGIHTCNYRRRGGVQQQFVIADPTSELDHGLVQAAGTLVVGRGVVKRRLPLPLPLLVSPLRGVLPCGRSRPLSGQLSDGQTAEASRNW
ncbi:unnamed protein product, partial [Musa textilis]